MEQLALRALQGAAIRLLSQRLFAGLIVQGLKAAAKRTHTAVDDQIVVDVAVALGREDLIADDAPNA